MGARVKALSAGFYGGARRRPGQVFELAEGDKPGSWMEVVSVKEEPAKPKAQKAKGEGPSTFSEMTKQEAKALIPKGAEDLV